MDIASCITKASEPVRLIQRYLYSDAPKQMFVNYVNEQGLLDNSVHDSWQRELNEIGFPLGDPGKPITNLAIVNGGIPEQQAQGPYFRFEGKVYSGFVLGLFSAIW